jgi:hypothetical protein
MIFRLATRLLTSKLYTGISSQIDTRIIFAQLALLEAFQQRYGIVFLLFREEMGVAH